MNSANRPEVRPAQVVRCVVLALIAAASVFAPTARAETPEPLRVTVLPCYGPTCDAVLVAPGPLAGTTYTITIRNPDNQPIAGASVFVGFNSAVRVCSDAYHGAVTDANGTCSITLKAGGCIANPTAGACFIVANGIEIRSYTRVRSPDNSSHVGSVASGTVTVSDLVFFSEEFKGQAPAACHDYSNDGAVTIADLVIFGEAFHAGSSCPLTP